MRARDNPFRASRIEALRYRADGFSLTQLIDQLHRQGGRGLIHGPHGRGKTTLLHALAAELERRGTPVRLLRPDPDDRQLARRQLDEFCRSVDRNMALLLDGADRVGVIAWRRLVRATAEADILVATSHRTGRLPSLHRCQTHAALLAELVAELDPQSTLDSKQVETMFRRHHGNVRMVLLELFRQQSMLQ